MAVKHGSAKPQEGESPYKIDPDNITVVPEDVGKPIKVTLRADIGESFNGFMLEARKPGDTNPQGTFSLKEESLTRLQECDGINGKAVTQTNNRKKTLITITWSASETGIYFFRATFTKTYDIFWLTKDVPNTTLAPPTTTTIIMSDVSSTTLAPPTTITKMNSTSGMLIQSNLTTPTSAAISISLTHHVIAYSALAESSPLLVKDSVCVWTKVTSFLSLAFSLAAFILSMIDTGQVVGKILAGVVVSLNLGQTILIFFLCGPSHKLRKIFFCVLRVAIFINLCFTENTHQTTSSRRNRRVSYWCTGLVVFSCMNVALTIAFVLVLFLCD
ncbi:hypothetical protein KOW79_004340 [Hemibagrus wyckioides]|uniref:Reelin domain-containing protein n=1 Tax=Hemibagrus wyckioides TaxID=337641 RepID=A0A9D3P1Q4_9TELE|nr:hypothetical protein KOW79_004340 [Hemibagrus wyckioides]